MIAAQKECIEYLRQSGESYSAIAAELDISVNTVKSYCRRNRISISADSSVSDLCVNCGLPLTHVNGAKKKRFCSDKCRMTWWNAHLDAVKRKAVYHFICPNCGSAFESYGNAHRKYCSRACAASARRASDE